MSHGYRMLVVAKELRWFELELGESDLWIAVDRPSWRPELVRHALEALRRARHEVESWLEEDPLFASALSPYEPARAPGSVVGAMFRAARAAEVGPMAAVAGAVAQQVGRSLLGRAREVVVENGGDVFLRCRRVRVVGIYAPGSSLSLRVGLRIDPRATPLGICTSSGTMGRSFSQGRADAAVAVAGDVALADAAATRLGNLIKSAHDLPQALRQARAVPGLAGAVLIKDGALAAWGRITLVPLDGLLEKPPHAPADKLAGRAPTGPPCDLPRVTAAYGLDVSE